MRRMMWKWVRLIKIIYVILRFRLYHKPDGVRLCKALESLGSIFVKAGQLLSTRHDLIPSEMAFALSKLQDRAHPFSSKTAKKMLVRALGEPLSKVFSSFEDTPFAAASIAQVHAACLHSGEEVVVKILRPHIHRIIQMDIDLMRMIARWVQFFCPSVRPFKPLLLVEEIANTLMDEVDLMKESANASLLRRHFQDGKKLYVPRVHWAFCRKNVMVSERIYGIPIYDVEALKSAGFQLESIARLCIEVFYTQVFRDHYFHADLHPGNIFVKKESQELCLIVVDFGIMGSLNTHDQRYIAENMMAFFERDYQRVGELHIASGWLPPGTRLDRFESAIRAVSEPMFGRAIRDISFGQLLLNLFQVAREFHINIQPQLVLLQKTVLSIESLGRQLAPELDLWMSSKPYLERWLKREVGMCGFVRRIRKNAPKWSEILPELPDLVYEVLQEKRIRQEHDRFFRMVKKEVKENTVWEKIVWMVCGALVLGIVMWVI